MSFESPGTPRSADPPQAGVHSDEEVEQAIRALASGDFKKLRAAAYVLVRGLGLETAGRDHEDLYSEALARTLSGSRGWRRGVDFMFHLAQAMRSIAWTWREAEDRRQQAGIVASPPNQGGHPEDEADTEDPMDPVSPEPDVEAELFTSRELRGFYLKFRSDRPAGVVIHGWARGDTMHEMARRTGISTQDLQWAARRIRRFAQKIGQDQQLQQTPSTHHRKDSQQGNRHDRGAHHGQ